LAIFTCSELIDDIQIKESEDPYSIDEIVEEIDRRLHAASADNKSATAT